MKRYYATPKTNTPSHLSDINEKPLQKRNNLEEILHYTEDLSRTLGLVLEFMPKEAQEELVKRYNEISDIRKEKK